ncbi:MAG: RNA polymerase sigma factor [Tannerella sp.]|jgi:RNA polymerase sigma-70 factor (ECF subfamily)|nr:RNA polymerase sigma factor [Tannerella sp.]
MDSETFKQKYLPLHPKLYRVAFALTGDSRDAEDVMQETYLRLWKKRGELDDIRHVEAFCLTLVKHLSLDLLRAAHPQDGLEDLPLHADASPESEAIAKDTLCQVRRLIDNLPLKQQQVLRLSCIDDCRPEEVEELTGLSSVNVRVLLSRARKTLREKIGFLLQ